MSKKRGLSLEDKRNVILQIYHDSRIPYNLKEIESRGSKAGVVSQTIKDVNQSLVDDSMVMVDKIGSANIYWSFPSKAYHDKSLQLESLIAEGNRAEASVTQMKSLESDLLAQRVAKDRVTKLMRLNELKARETKADAQIESLKVNDPAEISRIQAQARSNMDNANRWTDNIWGVKQFLTKKKGMSGKEVDKMLCIDGSFDYVTAPVPKAVKKR